MADEIRGSVNDSDDAAIGKNIRTRRFDQSGNRIDINVDERPVTSRDYLESIYEFEQRAANTRSWIIVTQVGTVISLAALVVVLWVIGITFANYVNLQFDMIDRRFETIERRLDTIDRRIQRIATPEPDFFRELP